MYNLFLINIYLLQYCKKFVCVCICVYMYVCECSVFYAFRKILMKANPLGIYLLHYIILCNRGFSDTLFFNLLPPSLSLSSQVHNGHAHHPEKLRGLSSMNNSFIIFFPTPIRGKRTPP